MMNRREFIVNSLLIGAGGSLTGFVAPRKQPFEYIGVSTTSAKLPIPEGKSLPFGKGYFALDTTYRGVALKCLQMPVNYEGEVRLRLQLALDVDGEEEIEVYLGDTFNKVGQISIWYGVALQTFETRLETNPNDIRKFGLRLISKTRMNPIFLLPSAEGYGTHLLLNRDLDLIGRDYWLPTLYSSRSVSLFGWMEGISLEGMHEMAIRKKDKLAIAGIHARLQYFLSDSELKYVDNSSRLFVNKIEKGFDGLPFATIAHYYPQHPSLTAFTDYCESRFNGQGKLISGELYAAETYTLAYPLALMGVVHNNSDWQQKALFELQIRVERLLNDNGVYASANEYGERNYAEHNWGRAYALFVLGLVKSLDVLQRNPEIATSEAMVELKKDFVRAMEIALRNQNDDGGWKSFIDNYDTYFEASTTAGFGAALAHGMRLGWLPASHKKNLQRIFTCLQRDLSPDGYLCSVTQQNVGSMILLQEGTYRIMAPYALGLMAQIRAHL